MAGEALRQMKKDKENNQTGIATAKEAVYGGGLAGFDAAAAGAGSKQGNARLSKRDIKGLRESGVSREDILKYVEDNPDVNSSGGKAQKLLNKFKKKLGAGDSTPEEEIDVSPDNPPEPDVPETDTAPIDTTPAPTPTPGPTPSPAPSDGYIEAPGYQYGKGDDAYRSPVKVQTTDDTIADLRKFNDLSRETHKYYQNESDAFYDRMRGRQGDPTQMFTDTLRFAMSMHQDAKDQALIDQTRIFGDLDNWKPTPLNTERFVPEKINDGRLEEISEGYKDDLDDL